MIGCLPSCENKPSAPLAQSVEHLPFKQGVRGSGGVPNPLGSTKNPPSQIGFFFFVALRFFGVKNPGPQAAFD